MMPQRTTIANQSSVFSPIAEQLPAVDEPNLLPSQFFLKGYLIDHQGLNSLNIDISYISNLQTASNQLLDLSSALTQQIDRFLIEYPNESDNLISNQATVLIVNTLLWIYCIGHPTSISSVITQLLQLYYRKV